MNDDILTGIGRIPDLPLLPDILDVPDEVTQLQRKGVLVVFDDEGQSVEIFVRGQKIVVHLDQKDETAVFLAPNGEAGAMLSIDHAKVMHECQMGTPELESCIATVSHLKEQHGILYSTNW